MENRTMKTPLQITFRDMDPSPALEERIREGVSKLEEHCERMVSCRVVVEAPHKHRRQGRHFQVKVDIMIPGREIAVGRNHVDRVSHEDAYIAVRDVFRAARRALDAQVHGRKALARSNGRQVRLALRP
jgi:ribosome-associated translation inhibitor RaiA